MTVRLDKFLADMQVGTRSAVKDYIRKGMVKVNNTCVIKPEYKVNTDSDIVSFKDNPIHFKIYEYYMLNKPSGVISASSDPKADTVVDLIKTKNRKDLFPVGRLDKDTEGLLLITNDGKLAHNLLSPKKHVDKVYYAVVKGLITDEHIDIFKRGVVIAPDFTALPAGLEVISHNMEDDTSEVNVTIHEGKFHQVKKMFSAVGSEVIYLKRLSMGELKLDSKLNCGEYRELTQEELRAIK